MYNELYKQANKCWKSTNNSLVILFVWGIASVERDLCMKRGRIIWDKDQLVDWIKLSG